MNKIKWKKEAFKLEYKGYTLIYKRITNNYCGHPRYEVLLFNELGYYCGTCNICSYCPETDAKKIIIDYMEAR